MAWATILPGILGTISSGIKGFFGVKESQLNVINKALDTMDKSNLSAGEREKAIASIIASESSSGYWLSAVWRPLLMVILCGIVLAYSFGFTTANLLVPMPEGSVIAQLFELLKIGVMGYLPLRTVDKAIETFTRSSVLKNLVEGLAKK